MIGQVIAFDILVLDSEKARITHTYSSLLSTLAPIAAGIYFRVAHGPNHISSQGTSHRHLEGEQRMHG